jgi:hypothetical protein
MKPGTLADGPDCLAAGSATGRVRRKKGFRPTGERRCRRPCARRLAKATLTPSRTACWSPKGKALRDHLDRWHASMGTVAKSPKLAPQWRSAVARAVRRPR